MLFNFIYFCRSNLPIAFELININHYALTLSSWLLSSSYIKHCDNSFIGLLTASHDLPAHMSGVGGAGLHDYTILSI